jgi:hypothetical protein
MDELRVNVENVIRLVGIDQCGLATFTTRRNCTLEEFQRLWNSYVTNVLRPRFGNAITVIEAQMRGAPHAHCFMYVGKDVRTGVRWIRRGKRWMLAKYSGGPALREIQAFLYGTWNRYCRRQHGTSNEVMGTAHFLPTRQNAESIACIWLSTWSRASIIGRRSGRTKVWCDTLILGNTTAWCIAVARGARPSLSKLGPSCANFVAGGSGYNSRKDASPRGKAHWTFCEKFSAPIGTGRTARKFTPCPYPKLLGR